MLRRSANFQRIPDDKGDAITAETGSIKPPAKSLIVLFDVEHEVDLDACRLRASTRAVELLAEGKTGSLRGVVAEAAGVDYKTVVAFLDGGRISPEKLIAIVERGLGLKFADIVKPSSVGKEA